MFLCAVVLLVVAASSNYFVVLTAMVVCGGAWEVLYVNSLTGVQFEDRRRSGLMTGLFFSGTLGGVTLGALAIGGIFDAIGIGWGLTACAVAIALAGAWASRQPSAAEPAARAREA
jgi:predicted MFS family arabinose efflux permease